MTDFLKEKIEHAKGKAVEAVSQYKNDVLFASFRVKTEIDHRNYIGLPHVQESEIYDEMKEELAYLDELIKKIREIDL